MTTALLKRFVLKHTFNDISTMKEDVRSYSDSEEHFDIPWRMYIVRKDGDLGFYLNCQKPLNAGKWSIKTEFDLKIVSTKTSNMKFDFSFGNEGDTEYMSYGSPNFFNFEEMKKEYLVNDKLTVEAHVTIIKMTGFYEENSRNFDATVADISDFVITAEGKDFHISRLFLASQSSYLKELVMNQFNSDKKLTFIDLNCDDFQKFLEVLYGETGINESTVEAILAISKRLATQCVTKRCEDYLIDKSKKPMKTKLQLVNRYGLATLKDHCLATLQTADDVRSVVPSDITQLDRDLLESFLQKFVSLSS